MNYSIVGSGQMGCEHILCLRNLEGATIISIAEPDAKMRELAKAMIGSQYSPLFYETHTQLLEHAKPDILIIATPNFTHKQILEDVLEYDVNVLIEKPLAISVKECKSIIAKSESNSHISRLIWVGLEYRYIPVITELLKLVDDGFFGIITNIYIREHRYPFLVKTNNWNRFSELSGGTLIEKCCHFFDLMYKIAGSEPLGVFASGSQTVNHLSERYDGKQPDMLDNAYVIVEFNENLRACLDLCMYAEASEDEQLITVIGTDGKAEAHIPSQELVWGKRSDGHRKLNRRYCSNPNIKYSGFHWGSTYLEHLALKRAVEKGLPPQVSLQSGLMSVALGETAQLSIKEKRFVHLDEII